MRPPVAPGGSATVGGPDVEEPPPDREEGPAQDGGEGQALPLHRLPQAEPEAREGPRTLVLPELPSGSGCPDPMTILSPLSGLAQAGFWLYNRPPP